MQLQKKVVTKIMRTGLFQISEAHQVSLRDGILEDAVIAVDGILAAPSEC
jgi:hypothetical protein